MVAPHESAMVPPNCRLPPPSVSALFVLIRQFRLDTLLAMMVFLTVTDASMAPPPSVAELPERVLFVTVIVLTP